MTVVQIWWKILPVYTEDIKFSQFDHRIYCTGRTFYAMHELSIRMQYVHNTKEMIAKVITLSNSTSIA